jgi:hypothetical protein
MNKGKYINHLDDTLSFGKYKNYLTIKQIIERDSDYIQWLFDNVPTFDLDVEAKETWRLRMLAKENK